MKIAIISVTNKGKLVSDKIYSSLISNPLVMEVIQYHKNVVDTIRDIFFDYDCIIGIMASGIMIRSIAPLVNSKLSDPAVLLIDDKANFVISLLSGHFGGANDLTLKISSIIDAKPIITTSTDVNNKIGIDSIAKRYYCNLRNPKNIKFVNKALVNDIKVELVLPHKFDFILSKDIENSYNITFDDNLDCIIAKMGNYDVILEPKNIVMGIGARRDISSNKVLNAIINACNILEVPINRIDYFATADVKAEEQGILDVMSILDKKLKIVSMSEIKNYENNECSKSDFVMKQFGVKGVCEPTCLIANSTNSHLLFKKTAYNGVTIAVSIQD